MKKKVKIAIAIALVGALGVLVFALGRDEGPRYEGKTVSYWLAHPKGFYGTALYDPILPKFDSNAVPAIAKALEQNDSGMKRLYISIWRKSPAALRWLLPEPVPSQTIKSNAMMALSQIGPDGKGAVPALRTVIKEDSASQAICAIVLLEHLGVEDNEVHDALVLAANSTNASVAKYASQALRRGGYHGAIPTVEQRR